MTQATPEQLERAWEQLQALAPVAVIRTESQYDQAVKTLHQLLEVVGSDETHPLYELLDTLGVLIHAYEESHVPVAETTGVEVLKLLMDEHQLEAADLPELGPASQVTAILAGRQPLSATQIQALARRFGVTPATFT